MKKTLYSKEYKDHFYTIYTRGPWLNYKICKKHKFFKFKYCVNSNDTYKLIKYLDENLFVQAILDVEKIIDSFYNQKNLEETLRKNAEKYVTIAKMEKLG